MRDRAVLREVIIKLYHGNVDGIIKDLKYLPNWIATPIHNAFYKAFNDTGDEVRSCHAAKIVADLFLLRL